MEERISIYEKCPVLESEHFLLRLTSDEDCDDLLAVYSDRFALPFFNSDNCNGDNFYYATHRQMQDAIVFWKQSYRSGCFARLSILNKREAPACRLRLRRQRFLQRHPLRFILSQEKAGCAGALFMIN